jgi:hypothetical protein
MVGGEVIGSVLLSRPAPYSEAEEQRIRESVSQAAPVLANLRNLAVAEIRAATDGLTGLPNKRAVTDALKRTFAQALMTKVAARAAPARPRPLQAGQRPARACRGDQVLANVGARCGACCGAGTSPAATAARSSRSCCPTPRSPRRSRSPSASARRSPRSPCRAPTCRSRSPSAWPASPTTRARWSGSSGSPTPRCTSPSGRAGTGSNWPLVEAGPDLPGPAFADAGEVPAPSNGFVPVPRARARARAQQGPPLTPGSAWPTGQVGFPSVLCR